MTPHRSPRRITRRVLFFLAVPLFAAVAFFAPRALAWGGHGHWKHRAFTAEEIREHMDHVAHRVLDRVDGSEAQHKELDGMLDPLAAEMAGFGEEGRALKKRFREALARETLDRDEIDALRTEMMGLADRASTRSVEALFQLDSVLTPEQRQELVKQWQRRHH